MRKLFLKYIRRNKFVSGIFWRYFAISIQFFVVVAVVRCLKIEDAAVYFSLFGVVGVFFTLSGLGLPDGLVRHLPNWLDKDVMLGRSLALQCMVATMALNSMLAALVSATALLLLDLRADLYFLILAIWWFGYAAVFLNGQILVALGTPGLGAFFAYSSINIGYLATLLPYLFLANAPTLIGALSIAAAGSSLAVIASFVVVLVRLGRPLTQDLTTSKVTPASCENAILIVTTGLPIVLSRFIQASLPWVPVWLFIASDHAENAAIYAAASRLMVIVTALIGALRFTSRQSIVLNYHRQQYESIVKLNYRASRLAMVPPVVAIAFLFSVGDTVVPLFLGGGYALAVSVVAVLILGGVAEAFGGLSDEILKMIGKTHIVLWSLGTALLVQVAIASLLIDKAPSAVAWATVAAFFVQYSWQILWLSLRTPIKIVPIKSR
ncbi:MAG: hypothetical protein RSE12_08415 [Fuscovulum sp.]|nr:MAG: hypothetical protein RSE12_08415 [Fuscovulum sp.]